MLAEYDGDYPRLGRERQKYIIENWKEKVEITK